MDFVYQINVPFIRDISTLSPEILKGYSVKARVILKNRRSFRMAQYNIKVNYSK